MGSKVGTDTLAAPRAALHLCKIRPLMRTAEGVCPYLQHYIPSN